MLFLGLVFWKKCWRWLCVRARAHMIPSDTHGTDPFKAYINDTLWPRWFAEPFTSSSHLDKWPHLPVYFTQKPQKLVVSGKHNCPGTTYQFLIQTLRSEDASVLLFSVFCWQLAAHLSSADKKAHHAGHNSEATWRVPVLRWVGLTLSFLKLLLVWVDFHGLPTHGWR